MTEEYKFKDWWFVAYEKHPTDGDLYLKEGKKPDLAEFLDHHLEELKKACDAGIIDDRRWDNLQGRVTDTIESFKTGDVAAIAKAFYDLGRAREEIEHCNSEEMLDLYQAKIKNMKREAPIMHVNLARKHVKEAAQRIAKEKWKEDTGREIRLGSMCEEVYFIIFDEVRGSNFEKALPSQAGGLKDWLRPIAPLWATKGGRPKKTRV